MINKSEPAVYEIDPSKKYILVFDEYLTDNVREKIRASISEWIKSDSPFMVITGGAQLVRVVDPPAVEIDIDSPR